MTDGDPLVTIDVETMMKMNRAHFGGIVSRWVMLIRVLLQRRRRRLTLSELSDDQLQDIGITPAQARTEVNKSWFWG
jgi:uncharacterized protein YjiS (DUF1127 family)